jgi:predicted kinase
MLLILPIGIPGSGKTSWISLYLEKFPETRIVSPDEIRSRLYNYEKEGQKAEFEIQVWDIAYKEIDSYLKQGFDCIFDATNIWKRTRTPIIEIGKNYNAKIIGVFFKIHPKLAILRNSKRERKAPEKIIYYFFFTMDLPTEEEGFAKIQIIYKHPSADDCIDMGGQVINGKCRLCEELNIE